MQQETLQSCIASTMEASTEMGNLLSIKINLERFGLSETKQGGADSGFEIDSKALEDGTFVKYIKAREYQHALKLREAEQDRQKMSKVLNETVHRLRQKHIECDKLKAEVQSYRWQTNERSSEQIKDQSLRSKLKSLKDEVVLYKIAYEKVKDLRGLEKRHCQKVAELTLQLEKQTEEISSLKKSLRIAGMANEKYRHTAESELALEKRKGEISSQDLKLEIDSLRYRLDEMSKSKQRSESDFAHQNHQLVVELTETREYLHKTLSELHDTKSRVPSAETSSSADSFHSMLPFLFPVEMLSTKNTDMRRSLQTPAIAADSTEELECMICMDQTPTLKLFSCQIKTICTQCAKDCIEKV